MPRLRLTIEYDGTAYHGWQRQAHVPTVQETLERAISRISGSRPSVVAAGRTDAGVHAEGQVAHFETPSRLDESTWRRALNAVLPDDVKILAVESAPDGFHARHGARGKRYQYRLLTRPVPSPIERRVSWHIPYPLNLAAMRRAAASLIGRHDFVAFESADRAHGEFHDTVCRLNCCVIRKQRDLVLVDVEGNRFLKYMVRNIVGTLVEVGLGRRSARAVAAILASGDRRQAGITAPAHGLTLMEVWYTRRQSTSARRT